MIRLPWISIKFIVFAQFVFRVVVCVVFFRIAVVIVGVELLVIAVAAVPPVFVLLVQHEEADCAGGRG